MFSRHQITKSRHVGLPRFFPERVQTQSFDRNFEGSVRCAHGRNHDGRRMRRVNQRTFSCRHRTNVVFDAGNGARIVSGRRRQLFSFASRNAEFWHVFGVDWASTQRSGHFARRISDTLCKFLNYLKQQTTTKQV